MRLLFVTLLACNAQAPSGDTQFSMTLTVPAGSEQTMCKFVKMPAGMAYATSGHHEYTPGSHHMLLYRTDITKLEPGMDQVQDCYEGMNGSIMSHVRGVLYGSQVPKASTMLPDGVAYALASEEVLLLQVHYLNATMAPLESTVNVWLHTTPNKAANLAGVLFFYDPFIVVPPASMATAQARCTLPQDITLLSVFPHYHARGVGYRAYLDEPSPAADPFYTSTDWTHPAAWTGGPRKIAAGSAIRWYCDYDNTSGSSEFVSGGSAATNEMCMFTGAYYPAMDAESEACFRNMNMFGNGTATCGDTLTCLQQCPSGATPMFMLGNPDIDPCWQHCFVASCPSASDVLFPELKCIGDNCSAECAAGSCAACAQQKCLTQSISCLNHACQ
jgi:hypothetical protein